MSCCHPWYVASVLQSKMAIQVPAITCTFCLIKWKEGKREEPLPFQDISHMMHITFLLISYLPKLCQVDKPNCRAIWEMQQPCDHIKTKSTISKEKRKKFNWKIYSPPISISPKEKKKISLNLVKYSHERDNIFEFEKLFLQSIMENIISVSFCANRTTPN